MVLFIKGISLETDPFVFVCHLHRHCGQRTHDRSITSRINNNNNLVLLNKHHNTRSSLII